MLFIWAAEILIFWAAILFFQAANFIYGQQQLKFLNFS
jgi:hypothetical protein